jgi:hypothetical protein
MKAIQLKFNSSTTIYFNHFEGWNPNKEYHVVFYEKIDGVWLESMTDIIKFQPGYYFSFFRRFFHELKVELIGFDEDQGTYVIDTDFFNPVGKSVKVCLDTDDKHEAYVWIEQAIEFGNKWNCSISIDCSHNISQSAKKIYKNINFDEQYDFYATYHIGRYDVLSEGPNKYGLQKQHKGWVNGGNKMFRSFSNPRDWSFLHSEQIARDILGLSENQSFISRYVDCDWFINKLQIKDSEFSLYGR